MKVNQQRLMEILALNSEEVFRDERVKKLKEENLKEIEVGISKLSLGINNGVDRLDQ